MNEAVEMYDTHFTEDFKWLYFYFILTLEMHKNDNSILTSAIKVCDIAIASNSRNLYAYFTMTQLLKIKDENEKMLEMAKDAVTINPNHTDAYFYLGEALSIQGEIEEAITAYQGAIKLNSHHSGAFTNLGNMFSQAAKIQ